MRHQIENDSPIQTQFEYVCELAETRSRETLNYLIQGGVNIHAFDGEYNPVMLLAKEGRFEAVLFLVDEFKANLYDAMIGALQGRHVELARELSIREVNLNHEVRRVAKTQPKKHVFELIARGANLNFAVWGAARAGRTKLTRALINQGASVNYAGHAAACGRHAFLVCELIDSGASPINALYGAALNGHIHLVLLLSKIVIFLRHDLHVFIRDDYYIYLARGLDAWDMGSNGAQNPYAVAMKGAAMGGQIKLFNFINDRYIRESNIEVIDDIYALCSEKMDNKILPFVMALNELMDNLPRREYFWINAHRVRVFNFDLLGLDESIWRAALIGDEEVMNHLMRKSTGSRCALNYAVLGAAQGGHQNLLKTLLLRESCNFSNERNRKYAAFGLTQGGHVKLFDEFYEERGVFHLGRSAAEFGAASRGYLLFTLYLNDEYVCIGSSMGWPISGAACGRDIGLLNQFSSPKSKRLNSIANKSYREAHIDYAKNFFSSPVDSKENPVPMDHRIMMTLVADIWNCRCNKTILMRYLSFIDHPVLREKILKSMHITFATFNLEYTNSMLLKKIEKLNHLIRNYNVGFVEAEDYLSTKPLFWLYFANNFPAEIFLNIWSFVIPLPKKEFVPIFNLASERIFDRVVKVANQFSFFKSRETIEEREKNAEDRYQKRAIFSKNLHIAVSSGNNYFR